MKKIIICLALILAIASPIFAFSNSPDGFRGIKWGEPSTSLGERKLVTGPPDYIKCYKKPEDKMSLGEIPLYEISYMFCEDRLIQVTIRTRSEYYSDLKQLLTGRYDEPSLPLDRIVINECEWLDEDAYVTLRNMDSHPLKLGIKECWLTIGSCSGKRRMEEVRNEPLKKAAEKAADDF